jgi:hypothetical protein
VFGCSTLAVGDPRTLRGFRTLEPTSETATVCQTADWFKADPLLWLSCEDAAMRGWARLGAVCLTVTLSTAACTMDSTESSVQPGARTSSATTSTRVGPMEPISSSPTTAPTCQSGSVSETVDQAQALLPIGALCLIVGTSLTVHMGEGWPVPTASSKALVLTSSRRGSTVTYRAVSIGAAVLQTTMGPPADMPSVTSLYWHQEVQVVGKPIDP